MSASLESLVRQSMLETERPAPLAGLVSFVIVGGSGAAAFVVLSSVAMALPTGQPRWLVSAICYALLILPVYLLHRRFSFRSEAPHGHAFPRYVAVQVAGLVLAASFSFVAYGVFALPTVAAALLVVGLTAGVNFFVLRHWAFAVRGR